MPGKKATVVPDFVVLGPGDGYPTVLPSPWWGTGVTRPVLCQDSVKQNAKFSTVVCLRIHSILVRGAGRLDICVRQRHGVVFGVLWDHFIFINML